MANDLVSIIASRDPAVRNRSLDAFCRQADAATLVNAAAQLEAFRHTSDNLYERVRAVFFLGAIYRYHLPRALPPETRGSLPYDGYVHLLNRRFEEAVESFLAEQQRDGPSDAVASALAAAYHALGFQTLADQVRRSVRSVHGNQWMFRMGHPADHPLEIRPQLLRRTGDSGPFPILSERTPVRMDLSHSGWSDIFFLGMDFPEGARVLNVSIDLGVRGRDAQPKPPIEVCVRVIDQPVLRLVSVDLKAKADVAALADVFDFAKDYLGLLKAAVIAAGIIPPGLEGSGQRLDDVLARLVGPGLGLEIVSKVNDIPKGSRLAVSTNLLAAIITSLMRATGQIQSLCGSLSEDERRLVAARAILGEWLGGSGGGWQDSGGVWPGIKMIEGRAAGPGDPEYGVSRGRLLPDHHVYSASEVGPQTRQQMHDSFVLAGAMRVIYDPITTVLQGSSYVRTPFAGNVIPASRQDAASRKIMDGLWSANNPGDDATGLNNFKYLNELNFHYYNYSARVDYQISDRWKVFGRVSRFKTDQDQTDFTSGTDPLKLRNVTGSKRNGWNIAADTVYTFNATTTLNIVGRTTRWKTSATIRRCDFGIGPEECLVEGVVEGRGVGLPAGSAADLLPAPAGGEQFLRQLRRHEFLVPAAEWLQRPCAADEIHQQALHEVRGRDAFQTRQRRAILFRRFPVCGARDR